ncbi:MAG: DUF6427 family protein, partial [Schleiferiaceae bacterium]|nr:DUF6427 family protein [Schleiferiaceae bacterium]
GQYIGASILSLGALYLYQYIADVRFHITRRNYFAPFCLAIILCWMPDVLDWKDAVLLSINALFLINFYKIYNSSSSLLPYALNGSLLSLIAIGFSKVGYIYLLLTIWQFALVGKMSWRTILLPLYGFASYFLIALGVSFLFEMHVEFINLYIPKIELLGLDTITTNWPTILALLVLLIFSFLEYAVALKRAPVLKRRILSLLFIQIGFTALVPLIFQDEKTILFLIIPTAILFSNYLQYIKKPAFQESWLWILILFGVVNIYVQF